MGHHQGPLYNILVACTSHKLLRKCNLKNFINDLFRKVELPLAWNYFCGTWLKFAICAGVFVLSPQGAVSK